MSGKPYRLLLTFDKPAGGLLPSHHLIHDPVRVEDCMRPRIVVLAAVAVVLIAPPLCAQEPKAGQGPLEAPVVVPNVVDKTVHEARRALQAVGLRLESDNHPVDEARMVVKRQQPRAGSDVPRGTIVKVTAAMPPPALVEVPDVTGRTAAEATDILRRSGVVARAIGGTGHVSTQDPPPGARVPRGTQVVLKVSAPPPASLPPAYPPPASAPPV